MHIGLHVKYQFFLSDFNANTFFWTDFRKICNIKFDGTPSIGSQVVVPCGWTDGRTDMTKLLVPSQFRERASKFVQGIVGETISRQQSALADPAGYERQPGIDQRH
jgi:hypothetical protein